MSYISAGGKPVHTGQLLAFLAQRARVADLGVTVVPSSSGAGWDVVLRLGGPYWDRLAAESAASAMRTATNRPAVPPAEPVITDTAAPAAARNTDTKENDHA